MATHEQLTYRKTPSSCQIRDYADFAGKLFSSGVPVCGLTVCRWGNVTWECRTCSKFLAKQISSIYHWYGSSNFLGVSTNARDMSALTMENIEVDLRP